MKTGYSNTFSKPAFLRDSYLLKNKIIPSFSLMPRNLKDWHLGLCKFIFLFIITLAPLYATTSDYGITSDEPIYQEAAREIIKWLNLPLDKMINRSAINKYWKTDPGRNVHPSGTKLLYITAQKLIFWEKEPYRQNAILNIIIFSFSIVAFFYWYFKGNLSDCLISIIILLSIPRFFAHAHFPATDIPMLSFLMLLATSMDIVADHRKLCWLPGIILGIFISFKITSILLIIPLIPFYLFSYREKNSYRALRFITIFLTGLLTFYIINPDYWFEPVTRIREFITSSATRKEWTPFTVFFAGNFYLYRAPFYYPFTMFMITTPILHIIFLFTGLWASSGRLLEDKKSILALLCLISPFIILSLPISPAHDGIRYLLPAFPFLVCFMSAGLKRLLLFIKDISARNIRDKMKGIIVTGLMLVIFAMDFHNPARVPPFELSYYNSLVGELSGAHKQGYETTYWWEIINDALLDQINEECEGKKVFFPFPPTDYYFIHLINSKKIKFIPQFDVQGSDFMLVFGRPYVRYWESYATDKYKKTGNVPVPVWSIDLDGVPLLRLYKIMRANK